METEDHFFATQFSSMQIQVNTNNGDSVNELVKTPQNTLNCGIVNNMPSTDQDQKIAHELSYLSFQNPTSSNSMPNSDKIAIVSTGFKLFVFAYMICIYIYI